MGLFDGLFKKKEDGIIIGSPADGECISISKVNDPTFAEEILGKGIAVIPQSDKVAAPADGIVTMVFPTGHAFTMETKDGVELLVHIGIDTVKLEGKFFTKKVSDGTQVKKGDLIIEADFDQIKAAGYDTTIPVVVCNTADFADVQSVAEGTVTTAQDVIKIQK
ncbi:MAG: PTS glucose transporter subunit IIA [Lachnospiraceae bacterium]|nr:PTS glucose transporter subunit IIA [Lachnospiraceae bacterium]